MTFYLRGLAGVHQFTKEGNNAALSAYIVPSNSTPTSLRHLDWQRGAMSNESGGWITDHAQAVAEAERLARRAAALGKDDAVALATAGFALADLVGDVEGGDALINQALVLNPNLAWAWLFSGWAKVDLGQPEEAIEQLNRAMRLSPNDPQRLSYVLRSRIGSFYRRSVPRSAEIRRNGMAGAAGDPMPRCLAAASAALAGQMETAQKAMVVLRQLDPNLRLSNLRNLQSFHRAEAYAKWEKGMRTAGLPE